MRPIPLALCTLLILAPLAAGLPPPTLPPAGPILLVSDGTDLGGLALQAAGYPECSMANVGSECYQPVSPFQFAAEPLSLHKAIVVPTHNGPGPVYDALVARKTDIATFVQAGGSLIALAEPFYGNYAFVPNPSTMPFYVMMRGPGESAVVTPYGATHPVTSAVTHGQLDGWGPTWIRSIGERPGYLFPVVEAYSGEDLVLTGNYGAGCVVVSTLMIDDTAAGWQNPAMAHAAALLLHDMVAWGLHCTTQPDFPLPYTGAVRIERIAGGPVTWTASPNLACIFGGTPTHHEVRCQPTIPPPTGAYWTCFGTTVLGSNAGVQTLTSEMGCGPTSLGSCTATQTQPTCFATTALSIDPFPFRCIAKPGPATTTLPTWVTTCGSFDP